MKFDVRHYEDGAIFANWTIFFSLRNMQIILDVEWRWEWVGSSNIVIQHPQVVFIVISSQIAKNRPANLEK